MDLETWVSEHQATVYRAARLILRDPDAAEDVAQETFLRAWSAADSLDEDANVRSWLYRIAVNLAINRLRSLKREAGALQRMGHEPALAPDASARQADEDAVARALRTLPERLRLPVVLRYYVDMSERDIAHFLQIRPGTVKSRLHEARRALQAELVTQ